MKSSQFRQGRFRPDPALNTGPLREVRISLG